MVSEKPKERKGLRIVKKANPKQWSPQKGDITKDCLYRGSGWEYGL